MKIGHGLLQWSDALATGIEQIDHQHMMLINILNEANLRFRQQEDKASLEKVIGDLVSYAVYHFDTEEELMEESAFGEQSPGEEIRHVREHRSFAAQVGQYQAAIRRGEAVDHATLFAFLNNWLINHVRGTDMTLGRHLHANRPR